MTEDETTSLDDEEIKRRFDAAFEGLSCFIVTAGAEPWDAAGYLRRIADEVEQGPPYNGWCERDDRPAPRGTLVLVHPWADPSEAAEYVRGTASELEQAPPPNRWWEDGEDVAHVQRDPGRIGAE
jgi:hypothetical protein